MKQEHLGDGAYVTVNRDFVGQIIITANHHDPALATDVVELSAHGIATIQRLIEQETVKQD